MKQFIAYFCFALIIVGVLTIELAWVGLFGIEISPHPQFAHCIFPVLLILGTIGHFLKK